MVSDAAAANAAEHKALPLMVTRSQLKHMFLHVLLVDVTFTNVASQSVLLDSADLRRLPPLILVLQSAPQVAAERSTAMHC